MASTFTRRPLPALLSLVALLLLTALVWWRVLHRGDSHASSCPTISTPASGAPTATLPAPAKVTVEVLNSTNRGGIAAKARTALIDAGFLSPKPATNDGPRVRVRGVAEIRYGPAGANGAKLLGYYFPGATYVPNTGKTAVIVVSLGERYTSVATPQTVQAALERQRVTTASPTPAPSGSPSC